jgi:hypothetical protein
LKRGRARNDHRIRPEAAKHIGHCAIEAGQYGANADNGARPDDHAQHGEQRSQLVRSNRIERQHRVVAECDQNRHSYSE